MPYTLLGAVTVFTVFIFMVPCAETVAKCSRGVKAAHDPRSPSTKAAVL